MLKKKFNVIGIVTLFLAVMLCAPGAGAIEDSKVYYQQNNTCEAVKSDLKVIVEPCILNTYSVENMQWTLKAAWNGGADKDVDLYAVHTEQLDSLSLYKKQNQQINGSGIDVWVDKTSAAEYMGYNKTGNGWEFYRITNRTMQAGHEYEIKWVFTPADKAEVGKWFIFMKLAEDTISEAIAGDKYMFLDPEWFEIIPDANTIALWHMNEGTGTAVNDSSTNGYNLTKKSATEPAWTTDDRFLSGYALDFDASNDYVNATDCAVLDSYPASGTLEFWFKTDVEINSSLATTQTILSKMNSWDGKDYISLLFLAGDGRIVWIWRKENVGEGSPGYEQLETTTDEWLINTWYHIAITWGSTGMHIYVNNTEENSAVGQTFKPDDGTECRFRIGDGTGTSGCALNGETIGIIIDELAIWNYQKTDFYLTSNLTITSPKNVSYFNETIDLNVTNSSVLGNWYYNIDNITTNYSFTPNTTINVTAVSYFKNGAHNITVNANDSVGRWHSDTVWFTLKVIGYININYSYPGVLGFRDNATENLSITVTEENGDPVTCNITFNSDEFGNETFLSGVTRNFNVTFRNGVNNITALCYNNVTNVSERYEDTFNLYMSEFILINEQTGLNFNITNESIVMYAPLRNWSYNFSNETQNWIYYIFNETDDVRLEIEYSGLTGKIVRSFNMSLITEDQTRICVAPQQTLFEQVLYSSSRTATAVYSIFADCYVGIDYTKYAYSDALMLRVFTMPASYDIYTWPGGSRTILGALDGGIAQEINLDLIEFAQRQYSISILTEGVSLSAYSNTTIVIYYSNPKEENDWLIIKIWNGTSLLYSHTETASPNELTLYYDHSSINLTNELLKLEVLKYSDGGLIGTITRLFYATGLSGSMNPSAAIAISVILLFFSLTFVAVRYVFGFFGIITTLISLAILTMAPANQYVIFMQVIEVIMLIFIIILFKEEYASVT